jgi:hypothetical protein
MKRYRSILVLLSLALPLPLQAQWQLLPAPEPPAVFAGDHRVVNLTWLNTGDQPAEAEIRTRLWQASSSTAIRLGDTPWKTLRAQPHQTILEQATLDFPAIKAPTTFILQWLDRSNQVLGTTRVQVYPTNLLDDLKRLLPRSGDTLGVLDPHQQLIPTLRPAALPFINLAEGTLTNFAGQLLLVGPCNPADPEWDGLADRLRQVAGHGTPVVWIQAPPARPDQPRPSFYLVTKHRAVVLVVNPELLASLPDQPQSQLNLIYFCQLALHPEPFNLPDPNPQPQL